MALDRADYGALLDIPDLDFAFPGGESTGCRKQDAVGRKRYGANLLRMARECADDLASGVGEAHFFVTSQRDQFAVGTVGESADLRLDGDFGLDVGNFGRVELADLDRLAWFGAGVDPLLDGLDFTGGQRFAAEGHGWGHPAGDHQVETALGGIAGHENGPVISTFLDTLQSVQIEVGHLGAAGVTSDAVFGEDRRDVFGEFLRV